MSKNKSNPTNDNKDKTIYDKDGNEVVFSHERIMKARDIIDYHEERNKEVAEIFKLFDKNDNGSIEHCELSAFLESIGRPNNDEDIDHLIEEADKDKNGSISLEEFIKYMDKNYVATEDTIKDVVAAFQVFDRDNNGYVSKNEFRTILTKFGENNFTEEDIQVIFEMVDINKDGNLDYAEFIEMWKWE